MNRLDFGKETLPPDDRPKGIDRLKRNKGQESLAGKAWPGILCRGPPGKCWVAQLVTPSPDRPTKLEEEGPSRNQLKQIL